MNANDPKRKLTFFSREPVKCHICGTESHIEAMLTGRGRLNAGELTNELRRLYVPSRDFGPVWPMIYAIHVCPGCYVAIVPSDRQHLAQNTRLKNALSSGQDARSKIVSDIFGEMDFTEPRTLKSGLASYLLHLSSLSYFGQNTAPTIRRGISALRSAWLSHDLFEQENDKTWEILSSTMYRKALTYYQRAIQFEESGAENISTAGLLGPDTDHNFGFDGVRYVATRLVYKFAKALHPDEGDRFHAYEEYRRLLSRVFALGHVSKEKPGPLLDIARKLYEALSVRMQETDPEKNNPT